MGMVKILAVSDAPEVVDLGLLLIPLSVPIGRISTW